MDEDPLSSLFGGGGLFGGDVDAPRAPKKTEAEEDTSELLAKLMKSNDNTEKIAARLKKEKKDKNVKKKKEEERLSKVPKKSNDVSEIFGNEAVASLRRGDEGDEGDEDDFLKEKTRRASGDIFGDNNEDDDEDEQIRNTSTSGKGELFGGFQKKKQDKIEISELKVSSTLGAASTGDNLFTEDVEDVVASAKEDAASQLHVSDDKLKALDLFIGTEDDDGSAAKPSKSGSIDKTFGGLSLFDTTSKGKEKPKASDVDDLFSMTSNDDGNASGGGGIDSSFDFSSYIQNNS